MLVNACNVAVAVGQVGTGEEVQLAPGMRQKYSWQSGSAKRLLHLWLASAPNARVALDVDGGVRGEVRLDVDGHAMFVNLERASGSDALFVTFLGSFLFHSTMPLEVTLHVTRREARKADNVQQVVVPPSEAVGILFKEGIGATTTVKFSLAARKNEHDLLVPYPQELVLDEVTTQRVLMETAEVSRDAAWQQFAAEALPLPSSRRDSGPVTRRGGCR